MSKSPKISWIWLLLSTVTIQSSIFALCLEQDCFLHHSPAEYLTITTCSCKLSNTEYNLSIREPLSICRVFKSLWMQLVLVAKYSFCVCFFCQKTKLSDFKPLRRVDFLLWVKGLKYCINFIWLKCMYWNILHSTYNKTVVDVKFCEGGSLLAVLMINLHNSDCKICMEIFWVLVYGHCDTLGANWHPSNPTPLTTPPRSASFPHWSHFFEN